jgi:hypothetical protein
VLLLPVPPLPPLPLLLLPLPPPLSRGGADAATETDLEVEAATTAPLLLEGLGGEPASESAVASPVPLPPLLKSPVKKEEEEEEEKEEPPPFLPLAARLAQGSTSARTQAAAVSPKWTPSWSSELEEKEVALFFAAADDDDDAGALLPHLPSSELDNALCGRLVAAAAAAAGKAFH